MNVHYFQHVPFEGLGYIETWLQARGFQVTATHFYEENPSIPNLDDIDVLVVMGGPMGVYDDHRYPWLHAEKVFIEDAITAGKKVMGICLGAQLIALCLGAFVNTARNKEIGWYPVYPTSSAKRIPWFESLFKNEPTVFHWHGDQFEIPYGAADLLTSAANCNQAFLYQDHVLALQFHLEVTPDTLKNMVGEGRPELIPKAFIQEEALMLAEQSHFRHNHELLESILNKFML
ncbi:type 1 glutamine amidotransferase [Pedobacter caeni]|uniref:GMP synthase-Glutamine amidotransferase n=1 Tax=Pedobacter caeni TaxID=288992 RepID=A0A1M5DPL6_9SPHI|nr:amidotransferase [Pedobacter caeni]SHF68978.1 GMP synthase-Glutamine amidotransferase [Pedobacter caeni]